MKNAILEAKNISFNYNEKEKLFENLSFTIIPGTINGILGENGSGKTTLFKLSKCDQMKHSGVFYRDFSAEEIISIPQVINLSQTLKNHEVLELIAHLNRISIKQAIVRLNERWCDRFFNRYERIKSKSTIAISYGEKRWLTISLILGLCSAVKIILLDEPTVGIDIQYRILIWELIEKLRC